MFCFVLFLYLISPGDPISRKLLFPDPQNHYKIHLHIQLRKTQSQAITIKSIHTLCGQWLHLSLFFKQFRGAGLDLNPEHPIALAQHHH